MDHERGRIAAPLPGERLRRALVARRQAHAVSRRRRAEGRADLRPLDGCRRRGHADHARRRRRRATRAGRPTASRSRSPCSCRSRTKWTISMPAEPKGAKWTRRAARRGHAALPPGSGRLPRRRLHALFVVPADGGTPRQLTSGKWSVGAGELRGGASLDWTPDSKSHRLRRPTATPTPTLHTRRRRSASWTSRRGAVRELGHASRAPGAARRLAGRQDGRLHRLRDVRKIRTPCRDLYVMPLGRRRMRKISGDYDRDPINLRWAPDGSGVYFDADDRGARNILFAAIARRREAGDDGHACAHHATRCRTT